MSSETGHIKPRARTATKLCERCAIADSTVEAGEELEPHLLKLDVRWGQTYLDEHEVEVDYDELEEKFVIGNSADWIEDFRRYEETGGRRHRY